MVVAIESGWGIRKSIKLNRRVYWESDTGRLGMREENLVAGRVVIVVTKAGNKKAWYDIFTKNGDNTIRKNSA